VAGAPLPGDRNTRLRGERTAKTNKKTKKGAVGCPGRAAWPARAQVAWDDGELHSNGRIQGSRALLHGTSKGLRGGTGDSRLSSMERWHRQWRRAAPCGGRMDFPRIRDRHRLAVDGRTIFACSVREDWQSHGPVSRRELLGSRTALGPGLARDLGSWRGCPGTRKAPVADGGRRSGTFVSAEAD